MPRTHRPTLRAVREAARVGGRWPRRFAAILAVALLANAPSPAAALDVDRVEWGFDGQVVANRFNLLSVLISNPTATAFDGQVVLRKANGARAVDAPIFEPLYLAPHSSRWVQLYPFSKSDWEEWTLSWGPAQKGERLLTKPGKGDPACVLLEEVDALPSGGGSIRRFPANLFPAQVTATDGLSAVVLDHVPRWEEPRQRAFLDWVRRGGRVHLLHDNRENYPQFTGALSVLNSPRNRLPVGAGFVVRHLRQRNELTHDYVERVIRPDRRSTGEPDDATTPRGTGAPATAGNQADNLASNAVFSFLDWDSDDTLLTALRKMSNPGQSWVIIHLLSLTYIGLIFPGCFLLAQRRAGDYRFVFGALLSIVAVFSLAFLIIGRRGSGEKTAAYSLAVARALDSGRYDVTGWTNPFVVEGGDYTFKHQGTGRLYSTCQDTEAVLGAIRYGADAGLTADVPPFSSRPFGFRAVFSGPDIAATVAELQTELITRQESVRLRDMTLAALPGTPEPVARKLVLIKGPQFPTTYQKVFALLGRTLYLLVEKGDRLEMQTELGSLVTYLRLDQPGYMNPLVDPLEMPGTSREDRFEALFSPLLIRSLGFTTQKQALDFRLSEDRLRLFVYAPLPEAFQLQSAAAFRQEGFVLYSLDIPFENQAP